MSDPTMQVLLSGGPDDQTDPRLLPPGSVVSAVNQVYDQDGSYQPRFGYLQIGPSSLTNIRRLAVFVDELVAVDKTTFWTYDKTQDIWQAKDVATQLGCTHRPLFNAPGNFNSYNEVAGNGYRVAAWVDASATAVVRFAIYSIAMGSLVVGPEQVNTVGGQATNVQVAVVGTAALITWLDVLATSVYGVRIDLTSLSVGSVTQLSDPVHPIYTTGAGYALCSTASVFIITYETASSGGTHIGQFETLVYGANLSLVNAIINSIAAHYYQSIAIAAAAQDGGDLWVVVSAVGYITDSAGGIPSVWAYRCNPAAGNKTAGPIDCGSGTDQGICQIGVDIVTGHVGQAVVCFSGTNGFYYNWVTTSGASYATAKLVPRTFLASFPFYNAAIDTTYIYVRSVTQTGPLGVQVWGSYYLLELGPATSARNNLVAILAPRIVNNTAPINASIWLHTPRPSQQTATLWEVGMPVIDNAGRQGMEIFYADQMAPYRWSPVALGRENYISGQMYDSNLLSEIGFPYAPQIITVTFSGSGSFTGTWTFVATYARINAQGDLEESAPSNPFTAVASAVAQFNVQVTNLTITQKQRPWIGAAGNGPVFIVLYRTQVATSGDTNHYRVVNEPFQNPNDPTVPQTTIHDTTTDASLTDGTHPTLYTDSGELAHNAPETFTHVCTHKNRLVGIAADQRTVWDSQQYVFAVTPAFNELATTTVDDSSEPLTAVASLYDKLLIFTHTRIYVRYGDGPAISGTGNDWTVPQRVPSPSGCVDPRSIVNTPLGVMFQGIMGLMLIDSGLNVTFIGRNVVAALSPYPICTSATWCENTSTIRFTFVSADDSAFAQGVIALYDVRRQRWAIHQIPYLIGGSPSPMQAAAWHPTLGYVTGYNFDNLVVQHGETLREATLADATPWLDYGNVFVPLTVTMAPIRAGGDIQGSQRVRRVRVLENYYTPHTLEVDIGYDYGATSEAHAYSDATVTGLRVGSRAQVRVTPAHGKCEAIQIVLKTSAPTVGALGTGRGAGLTGISFEVHARKGGYRNMGASAKT